VAAVLIGAVEVIDWYDRSQRLLLLAFLPLLTLPIAVRRRHPVAVLWTMCATAATGTLLLEGQPQLIYTLL
jgi:hypothetical protein